MEHRHGKPQEGCTWTKRIEEWFGGKGTRESGIRAKKTKGVVGTGSMKERY